MSRALRPSARLLALAAAGTVAAAPLLSPARAHRAATTAAPAAPREVPEPPSWPLVATGLAALGGAVALRRRLA